MRMALCVVSALCSASPSARAQFLPNGGHFVAGTGSIGGNGTSLTINQNSARGVIDWNGFSIGIGNRVTFENGNGATLNRVTGGQLSLILGTLAASGSVYLINPQGVIVGPGGTVSAGGRFVASTLDANDTAFMNGGPLALTGDSHADVVNLGKIGSSGGDVFLVAHDEVLNLGGVTAPQGSVEFAAGRNVLLQDAASNRQVFVQAGSRGTVANLGTVRAAQISLQAADGNIYAFGGNHSTLRATGTATRDGHLWLVADTGSVRVAGTLRAQNADGTGGTVDVSAATFALVGPRSSVAAGIWNLSTPSLFVTQPLGAAISSSLGAGTSVNIDTTKGDLELATNLGWNGNASLTLGAYGSVAIDQGITIRNQGAGSLTLRADSTGIDNRSAVTNNGTLDWSNSSGIVRALYDMNGTYKAGALLANTGWKPADGSGLVTQITAYQLVNSLADLQHVAQNLAGNYALGTDIAGNGTESSFTPIGSPTTPFSGQFDGMGHTIDKLYVDPVYAQTGWPQWPLPTGLFSVIGSTGVVRNLNLTHSIASANNSSQTWAQVGALAGINQGHITNVFASGNVTGSDLTEIGGLVGQNTGLIERSASAVNAYGLTSYIGGLVGQNDGTIVQCYATGAVAGASRPTDPAGLVGFNTGTGTIKQSFVTGPLAGVMFDPPAAIAGINTGTVAADNYWNVQTTGAQNAGGAPPGNGLTTAQMSNAASFVGWDFGPNGAWIMPAGATHPILRWQAADGASPL
jgi:filamentous hemagglutinin family protein